MCRNRPITTVVSFGSVIIAALHFPMVLAVVGLIVLLLCVGLILPAVWSRRPARRRDARAVLQQLLRLFVPARSDEIAKPTCVTPDKGGCPIAERRSANRQLASSAWCTASTLELTPHADGLPCCRSSPARRPGGPSICRRAHECP